MTPFELLIGGDASRQILELPADEQWLALQAGELVAAHPVTTGLFHWQGEDGITRYVRVVREWSITFRIDHADRAVRIF